jgi:hypothetical protein
MIVIPNLTGGIGNRLFQVYAAFGYAEQYNRKVYFHEQFIQENPHDNKINIQTLFPDIPFYTKGCLSALADELTDSIQDATVIKEESFPIRSSPSTVVVLQGYFQNEQYFPTKLSIPAPFQIRNFEYDEYAFLHFRRGDYLKLPKHNVPLAHYYASALKKLPKEVPIMLFSDDMKWVKQNIYKMFPFIDFNRWKFSPDGLNDIETLSLMTQCKKGAIGANSTFSWWGAYAGAKTVKSPCYFPAKWFTDGAITHLTTGNWLRLLLV